MEAMDGKRVFVVTVFCHSIQGTCTYACTSAATIIIIVTFSITSFVL